MMKAALCEGYGPPDVIKVREVPKPTPAEHDVLVRIKASTVDIADARIRALRGPRGMSWMMRPMLGFFKPRKPIFGMVFAGVVEDVGAKVSRFKAGDLVFGTTVFDFGCHAEYRAVREDAAIAQMPEKLSFEDAAALCFGAMTAMTFFRCGNLEAGERLLINGASGAVGTAAVQIAKHHVGAHVTGVSSGKNAALVRSLGADALIDYTEKDFTKDGAVYDVVMDCVGNAPFNRVKHLLSDKGRCFMVIGGLFEMIQAGFNKQIINGEEDGGDKSLTLDTIKLIAQYAEKGVLNPVIDRTYSLDDIVDAHAYVDTGRKTGNVVLTMP